jgi:hypothetical protein
MHNHPRRTKTTG